MRLAQLTMATPRCLLLGRTVYEKLEMSKIWSLKFLPILAT